MPALPSGIQLSSANSIYSPHHAIDTTVHKYHPIQRWLKANYIMHQQNPQKTNPMQKHGVRQQSEPL